MTDAHTRQADLLIRNARIVWPGSPYNGQSLDISVKNGVVESLGEGLESSGEQALIEGDNLHLSPGWMDMNVDFRDPGHEEKEDLHSGILSAMQGGYTRVLTMPSTDPPIDHRGAVKDLIARSSGYPLTLHPSGCLSQKREGEDIAELFDMKRAGAIAFTDGRRPVTDAGLLTNALWYSKGFDGRILIYPDDPTISRYGVMHEGELSIRLGMKGIPSMSEVIAVDRALHLLAYTDGRLHFSTLSTREAIERVQKAKKEGLKVSCEVSAHHLYFQEEKLRGFSSRFKIMPPLRDGDTVEALREGVANGTVDHICSLHEPQAEEDKKVEFEVAAYGAPGTETSFGAARKAFGEQMEVEALIGLFTEKPRELLGLQKPELEEGCSLEATLFDPDQEWVCHREKLCSKAYRSPYEGESLLGRPLGTVHQSLYHPIDG